jgi:ADP-dependent NAD(P)H-hydrate dehydratase / NAD(P)H-hydrate epimerase
MKIFSAAQIRKWDQQTIITTKITAVELMKKAATACFKWIKKNIPAGKQFIICCGSGNNGGDGLVIARLLNKAGYKISVYILAGNKQSEGFTINLRRLYALKPAVKFIETPEDFPAITKGAVVIDALYGTGLSRPLKGMAAQLVNHINKNATCIISIDMPTGLCADIYSGNGAIIKATHTLSFETSKLVFMLAENAVFTGHGALLSIGADKKYYAATNAMFETVDAEMISNIYKPRNASAHKYNFGHVLLYAGSKNMMGAGLLCTKACIRSGAGLVTIYVSPGTEGVINTALPEAITTSENDTGKSWIKKTVIAIGPGIESTAKNKQLLKKIVTGWGGPLVIDATALALLAPLIKMLPLRKMHPAILTPHTGEFEKLFGKTTNGFERLQLATERAAALNCYIVLKGHFTLIACPDGKHYFNTTGNAGMATAGSGDTLTGIITGLLAQGYTEKEACIMGVYLHGLAGDIAAEKISQEAMMASDITDCLGEGFKKIQSYRYR